MLAELGVAGILVVEFPFWTRLYVCICLVFLRKGNTPKNRLDVLKDQTDHLSFVQTTSYMLYAYRQVHITLVIRARKNRAPKSPQLE